MENFSWRWVFYINLPWGLLSALFVVLFLSESRDTRVTPAIDYVGAFTLIGWVVSVDPNSELKADHSPLFSRWTVVQLEHSWIY